MKISSINPFQQQNQVSFSSKLSKTGTSAIKKELVFLGPPACGKGTQTNRLSEFLKLPHIDTGSLLRAEIAKESEDGKSAKSFIDKGLLVPLSLVIKIIKNKLASKECENGYVLDGFPRNLEQAEHLEKINKEVDSEKETSFKAIYFDIDSQILLERIIHRQSCPQCGEIYNKKFKPSKVEDECDKCHVPLKTRADDNAEVAKSRFNTYFEQTAPLVNFYEDKGVLHKLDASGEIDDVWHRLLKIING